MKHAGIKTLDSARLDSTRLCWCVRTAASTIVRVSKPQRHCRVFVSLTGLDWTRLDSVGVYASLAVRLLSRLGEFSASFKPQYEENWKENLTKNCSDFRKTKPSASGIEKGPRRPCSAGPPTRGPPEIHDNKNCCGVVCSGFRAARRQ
jgi:hypothetical protein